MSSTGEQRHFLKHLKIYINNESSKDVAWRLLGWESAELDHISLKVCQIIRGQTCRIKCCWRLFLFIALFDGSVLRLCKSLKSKLWNRKGRTFFFFELLNPWCLFPGSSCDICRDSRKQLYKYEKNRSFCFNVSKWDVLNVLLQNIFHPKKGSSCKLKYMKYFKF